MDLSLPKLSGIEATRQITRMDETALVLAVSGHVNIQTITETLRAGARGFLEKGVSPNLVEQGICALIQGRIFFGPMTAQILAEAHAAVIAKEKGDRPGGLSEREYVVLQLVAEGMTSQQIATELGICDKTVENTRLKLHEKLGIHGPAQLTRWAIANGVCLLPRHI